MAAGEPEGGRHARLDPCQTSSQPRVPWPGRVRPQARNTGLGWTLFNGAKRHCGEGPKMSTLTLPEMIGILSSPKTVAEASLVSGLPDNPGLYAWWIVDPELLPGVPLTPRTDGLSLIYVGIARSRPNSAQTLRSRVLGKHIRGVIGNSTLRRSLAALLWEDLGWQPYWANDRAMLRHEHNQELKHWIEQNLRVAWLAYAEPWTVERSILEGMHPPLNVNSSQKHPFYPSLRSARACLDVAASGKSSAQRGQRIEKDIL